MQKKERTPRRGASQGAKNAPNTQDRQNARKAKNAQNAQSAQNARNAQDTQDVLNVQNAQNAQNAGERSELGAQGDRAQQNVAETSASRSTARKTASRGGKKAAGTVENPQKGGKKTAGTAENTKKGGKKAVGTAENAQKTAEAAATTPKKGASPKKNTRRGAAQDVAAPSSVVSANVRHKGGRRPSLGGPAGGPKLRIIPLGGLNEIGKNMTVIEYGDDMIVVDCGLGFPEEDMLGIDLVIPDMTYLENNRDKLRGIFLTHGHEDHIGAIPYLLRTLDPPIYGTKLTLGIIKNKLTEFRLPWEPQLNVVSAGDTIRAGVFTVEFIRVNHSIADACCLAIDTPRGMLIHTGDFKLDLTPIDGEMMDIPRLGELGNRGVLLLMCESTNAERPGYTPTERKVGSSLEYIFNTNPDKRIVIATFSSNVHRVKQIIDISARHGRRVAVTGRSMLNIVGAAQELGYMDVPPGVLVDINDIKRYRPEQLTLITTGSQGEPMSALYRMAYSDHSQVTLGQGDLVVLSSSAIPGNEKTVSRVINELCRGGVEVMHDTSMAVHVSGHACQEELKLMQALTKPLYFMPVHGEYRHMTANRELALSMGIDSSRIFISEVGKVLEIDRKGARFAETVPSGNVLVDGNSVGDVGNIVLRDRKHLSEDGLVVIVASVDLSERLLLSGPEVVSRGFVYVRESEELMDEVREVVVRTLFEGLSIRGKVDRIQLKNRVRDEVARFLSAKTRRKPMVLPIIMYV